MGVDPTSDDGRRREHDAFIRIVSGQATAGATLFSDGASWLEQIGRGATSLGTLVDRVTGKAVNEPDLEQAMQFMRPFHEGRHAILTSDLTQQQLRPPPGVHTGEAVKSE